MGNRKPATSIFIKPQAGGEALSSAQVAVQFWRNKVKHLRDMLAMMALVRHVELEDA